MDTTFLQAHITKRSVEATDIISLELSPLNGEALPAFSAGSHIDVEVKPGVIRQYSLCNHPSERHRYVLGILRDPKSRGGSIAVHDELTEGQVIRISEPRNHFPLAHEARRSLLFAGGIGVTPILCMAERLAQIGAHFEMYYCARSPGRAAFLERIRRSAFREHVLLHFDDGPAEQLLDADAVLANPAPETHLYVCGPTGFMDHVLGTSRRLGWPEDRVHREYFAAPAHPPAADGGFEVRVARTGQVFAIPPDRTIIAVLADNGIEVPVSCEQGVCGTCLTRVLEGEPDHRDVFMTDAEHALNDQFTPCCSRAKSKVLVLDL